MEWIGVGAIMGVVLIGLLLGGVWIAFALGITGVVGILITDPHALMALEMICWGNINSFILSAVPLFLFMGTIILNSGVSVRFYKGLATWLDYLPGSLVHTNIVACSIFAAVSGSSIATAAAIGSVAVPEMAKRGYDRRITYGSLAAGGTLGILIPPSIPLIIYGAMTEQSIGQLFIAGIIPGVILASIFILYIAIRTATNPDLVPRKAEASSWKVRLCSLKDIAPIAGLVVLVLGGIYMGVTTPTEAAAVGSAGALVIALGYRQLNFQILKSSLKTCLKINCMVMFIVVGAQIMAFALVQGGVPRSVVALLTGLPVSKWVVFTFICLMYIVLGMFVDALSCMLLTLPVVYPVIMVLGFDPIWFGVFMVVMLEVALITPPVGINLFVIHGIARGSSLDEVIRGALPYVFLMLFIVGILAFFPSLALWLPGHMIY